MIFMRWVYLSPHLDDVVLSCGGLIWEQLRAGEAVEIWTICAGDPPPGSLTPYALGLHERWQTGSSPVEERRHEDLRACQRLGAQTRHFNVPDCIYRSLPDGSPVVMSDEELFQPLKEGELPRVESLSRELAERSGSARLVSPLAMGGHMDHRLTRAAAEAAGRPLWYYADFPYVMMNRLDLRAWAQPGWQDFRLPVSAEGLAAWQEAVAAYRSQISTFWGGEAEMRARLAEYLEQFEGGSMLLAAP